MRGSATQPSTIDDGLNHHSDKQALVDWVFDHVADRYDLGNDIISLGWHRVWKNRLVDYARIQPDHRVLDIACGTGDLTWKLASVASKGEVIGTDINQKMMDLALPKRPEGVSSVRFVKADATELPFEDASFDRVIISYAGRGFPDWPGVVREAYRLLKPGGELWNLDFARPQNPILDSIYRNYLLASGAVISSILHGNPRIYMYIPKSMKAYRGQRWLKDVMSEEGFEAELIETTLSLMAFNRGVKP